LNKKFYEKSSITSKDNPINITYDELLLKSDKDIDKWIDDLRNYVITQWDEHGQPPVIGQNKDEIINKWTKLSTFNVNDFFTPDNEVVRNFSKLASGVNQFFPTMLKTKISTGVSSDNATSIYDMFKEDDLREKFSNAMKRGLYKDSMYSFGKSVKNEDLNGLSVEEFLTKYNNDEDEGITLIQYKKTKPLSEKGNYEWLALSADDIEKYLDSGVLTKQNVRTITGDIIDNFKLKNGQDRYYWYLVRLYKRDKRIFPPALQIFRLGLGQPAVNFPPLTAKFLYEHFTEHCKDEDITVYDPSSGWGGRILGAMCTNRKLHYVGTDPNPDNFGRYESVADFYNTHTTNKFWGDTEQNTYDVFKDGSEEIGNNPDFQKYKGKLDFVFTSPPYFNREQYSQDENQSFKKFSAYEDWRDNFLRPTLTTAYEYLKNDRYICWNIADIKVGSDKYIPLEQDSIDVVESLGGEYKGIYKMLMTRMVGIDASSVKNSVKIDNTYYKFEPILVFYKP